jgi:uncharacterized membrane protein HdeD (DUF308 family)
MQNFLIRNSWAIGVAGLVSIIFGFAILIWPAITLGVLIKVFGIFAFVQGAVIAVSAIATHREHSYWVLSLLWGLVGIMAGLYVINNPGITGVVLLFVIAAYALVRGVLDIVFGIALREEIKNEWLYILTGIVSVVFGLVIFSRPLDGAIALVWLIATYSIVSGALYIATAFAIHSLKQEITVSPAKRLRS